MSPSVPNVPDGYVHRSVLITRGWTAAMIDTYLRDVVKVAVTEANTSNKAYSILEVEHAEQEIREVRAAIAAIADRLPRSGPYDESNTVPRAVLVARGWTSTHITRLLGGPDHSEPALRGFAHHYGKDRVEVAEATDTKLRKRLAHVAQQKATAKAERIDSELASGRTIWRNHHGEWVAQGTDLAVGDIVEVFAKDHTSRLQQVTSIISATADGLVLARVRPPAAARPATAVGSAPVSTPPPRRPELVSIDPVSVGQVIEHRGAWVVITGVRSLKVDDDSPSLWGSVLLGHEGERVTRATYRPATREEAAPQVMAQHKAQERQRALQDLAAAVADVEAYVREHGHIPPTPHTRGTETVWSSRTIYGTGDDLRVSDTTVVWILWHGHDGDTWSANNIPSGIWREAPLTEEASRRINAVRAAHARLDTTGGSVE